MKNILIPTDFSNCAERAAQVGFQLAKRMNAKIHFYHHMDIPINWVMLEERHEKIYPDVNRAVKEHKEMLRELEVRAEKNHLQSTSFLDFEPSSDSINKYAKAHHIDLVVMGSHGASGLKELFLGSNAQRVVRNSSVPTFIVKDQEASLTNPKILFVSDFESEMMTPFIKAVEFADVLDGKIQLLYVNTPADFKRSWEIHEKMESFRALASKRLDRSEIVDCMYFEEGIKKYCEINGTDIISIATHHRKGLSRTVLGSLTEGLVNHLDLPVISLPI